MLHGVVRGPEECKNMNEEKWELSQLLGHDRKHTNLSKHKTKPDSKLFGAGKILWLKYTLSCNDNDKIIHGLGNIFCEFM